VSNLQTATFSGPAGSDRGTHRHRADLLVRTAQPTRRLFTPSEGLVEARLRATADPTVMLALWLVGVEEGGPEESGEICVAHEELFKKSAEACGTFRDWAWRQPIVRSDQDMSVNAPFHYEADAERDLCLSCLAHDSILVPRPWRRRRLLARLVATRGQRESRASMVTFADIELYEQRAQELSTRRSGAAHVGGGSAAR
jgi:hypothetical protein